MYLHAPCILGGMVVSLSPSPPSGSYGVLEVLQRVAQVQSGKELQHVQVREQCGCDVMWSPVSICAVAKIRFFAQMHVLRSFLVQPYANRAVCLWVASFKVIPQGRLTPS